MFTMNEDDDLAEAVSRFRDPEMRAWLDHNSFKLMTNYVRRGRAYRGLSNESLIEAWVENMREHCRNPGEPNANRTQNDLDAEMELRGLEMPLMRVAADLEIRRQYLVKRVEEMKKDGKEWEAAGEAMRQDLSDFLVDLEEAKERPN
jgi:hypothetical protein